MTAATAPRSKVEKLNALAERTADAFSFDRYRSWRGVCAMLLRRGFSEREAEAILRSKWTRWAADRSNAKSYGNASAADLASFIDFSYSLAQLKKEVAALVLETFGETDDPPMCAKAIEQSDRSHLQCQNLAIADSIYCRLHALEGR